jgi:hypothetical protein
MRLTKVVAGAVVVGGVLAASIWTDQQPARLDTATPRSLPPARIVRPRCPPPQVAPSCDPVVGRGYLLWDNKTSPFTKTSR